MYVYLLHFNANIIYFLCCWPAKGCLDLDNDRTVVRLCFFLYYSPLFILISLPLTFYSPLFVHCWLLSIVIVVAGGVLDFCQMRSVLQWHLCCNNNNKPIKWPLCAFKSLAPSPPALKRLPRTTCVCALATLPHLFGQFYWLLFVASSL